MLNKFLFELKFFICVTTFFSCSSSFGQTTKNIDSLIKASTLEIYENPNKALATGKFIVENYKDTRTKIRGLILIGDAYSSKRDYQQSLNYILKGKELSILLGDPVLQIKLVNKTAIQYQQLRIYDKAIQFLDESEKLCLEYPVRDSVRFDLGSSYIVRGFIYKEKLNCEIAISFFNKGIKEYLATKNGLFHPNLSITHYNKGNCYIQLSEYELAKKSFSESILIAKKNNANSLQAFAKKGLAEVYTLEGKYTNAIQELEEALELSNQVGDLVLNRGIYQGLSENFLATNQWEKCRKFHGMYLETELKLRESERKSISNSIIEATKAHNENFKSDISVYKCIIVTMVFLTVLTVVFFCFLELKNRKSIQRLSKFIENMQNSK